MKYLIKMSLCFTLIVLGSFSQAAPTNGGYDNTRLIGNITFRKNLEKEKILEIMNKIKEEFPDFEKLLVRRSGPESVGFDFEYLPKKRMVSKEFGQMMKTFVNNKFGSGTISRWSITSEVFWIKKEGIKVKESSRLEASL